MCRANLWPGPWEKSHLRNWVISAITEGSDKCIPRASTAFWDTDSPVARSHLKPERSLTSTLYVLLHKLGSTLPSRGKKEPRITRSCKLVDNVIFKTYRNLDHPGGRRGDIHSLAESMVQTSRVDWSAEEHFKPHPWAGTNLKGLLLCPPHCQERAPINLGVMTITTGILGTNILLLWFVPSNQHRHSGMKVWQDPEWLLRWRASLILFFQRDCCWALEVTAESPGFLILIQTSMFW